MRNKLPYVTKLILLLSICLAVGSARGQIPNPAVGFNPNVDYTLPNFSQSPVIQKFIDTLPGLNAPNASTTGSYIPVAIPDKTTYPDADYYELSMDQYQQQLARDLPGPSWLRGYRQTNVPNTPAGASVNVNQYLGPMIIAQSFNPKLPAGAPGNGRPVRLKVTNRLPRDASTTMMDQQNMFLPVDTMLMGASTGPNGGMEIYSQNRAVIHLHGGFTPWISDGTPYQWFTPAGEPTSYPKGASFQNVPDMIAGASCAARGNPAACFTPSATDGIGTYYYTNQQSARLMFYHDHAHGITRLNVYGGLAAPYLLVDSSEESLINSGVLPDQNGLDKTPGATNGGVYRYGIPLVIQDKSFVNDQTIAPVPTGTETNPFTGVLPATTAVNDPLWNQYLPNYTAGGNLWYPHEYMPNENIYDPNGFNTLGRWDYGPFMAPPMVVDNYTLPSPTIVPEQYGDTPVINGAPYPTLTLPDRAPVRFRILNAGNERVLNLQLYYAADQYGNICKADPTTGLVTPTLPAGSPTLGACTEVSMIPATPTQSSHPPVGTLPSCGTPTEVGGGGLALGDLASYPYTGLPVDSSDCIPSTWPTDGRDGGAPDPRTAGPPLIQIGNEGGLMPAAAVIPSTPINYDYNRRSVTVMGTKSHALMIAPAERADVIVDFSLVPPGSSLILYNDNPAPMPLYDSRNDYYTDDPDNSSIGGAPPTVAGWGPNTRTLMQINISPTGAAGTPVSISALNTALAAAYGASQQKPVVPNTAYDPAFGTHTTSNIHVQNTDETINLTGKGQAVASVMTTVPGAGYTAAPNVRFIGGGCTTMPAAVARLNGVIGITVTTAGAGYTTAPTVTIGPPNQAGGIRATAVAQISGGTVTAINMITMGSGYTTVPTVTLTGGGFTTAAVATATVSPNSVGAITLTNPGAGCTSAPLVFLTSVNGNGTGATASAILVGDTILDSIGIMEGMDMMYGRMNVTMATAPNPLNPYAIAPIAAAIPGYTNPPSDYWYPGQNKVFRVTHIGVDAHALHLHLGAFQVVNRVDWTNTYLPPDMNELGWKETIRTYPFTDLILASNIPMMWLPFKIPNSVRYLDPTAPPGSSANFPMVPPVAGQIMPAALTNVLTDYGWEYVYHCHYLDHEENDMMRPMVFKVTPPPSVGTITGVFNNSATAPAVTITWSGGASPGAQGFTIQRSTSAAFPTGTSTVTFTLNDNTASSYVDPTVALNRQYYYRVAAFNSAGNSAWSNTAQVPTILAPTGLKATVTVGTISDTVTTSWTLPANTTGITGYTIRYSRNAAMTGATTYQVSATATSLTLRNQAKGRTYYYQIRSVITGGATSAWTPATPLQVTAP